MRTALYIFEDSEAVTKVAHKQEQKFYIRHVSPTHRVDLDRLYDPINLNPMIQIKYVSTTQQLADILAIGAFTGDTWTPLTLLVNIMTHTTFTQRNLQFFRGCESFIFQHEQTCWRIFCCIGKIEAKASSLHSKDCEIISDKNADKDYHAPPPGYKAGGDSKRGGHSARSPNIHHNGDWMIIKLRAMATGSHERSVTHC